MKSTDKARLALDRAENLADDPNASTGVKMLAAMLSMGRGMLEEQLPQDPDEFDELLERGAQWLLALRSDEVVEVEQETAAS